MGRYAILKRYEVMRETFVFPEKIPLAYAYPRKRPLPLVYRGLGREERDLYDPLADRISEASAMLIDGLEEGSLSLHDLWQDREKTLTYASAFDGEEDYECVFVAGRDETVPDGLVLLGYDAGYAPEEELFSAVSDLFFFPVWHPDASGRAFLGEFRSLNENGLFGSFEEARAFAARYGEAFGDNDVIPLAVFLLSEE